MYSVLTGYLNMFQTCQANKRVVNNDDDEQKKRGSRSSTSKKKWLRLLVTHGVKSRRGSLQTSNNKPSSPLDFEFDSNDLEYYFKNYSSSSSSSANIRKQSQLQTQAAEDNKKDQDKDLNKDQNRVNPSAK